MKTLTAKKSHAKYSASGAERFINCPGSIRMQEGLPDEPSSAAASEGTLAHAALEFLLKNGNTPKTRKFLADTYPLEMIKHAEWAANEILDDVTGDAEFFSEKEVDLKWLDKDAGGTCDAVVVNLPREIIIYDFKYGRSYVPVEENLQLLFYGAGISREYADLADTIKFVILQPRTESLPRREWVISVEYLKEKSWQFADTIALTKKPDAPLNPNKKWCHFCKARFICPALSTEALKKTKAEFDSTGEIKLPTVKTLSITNVGEVLKAVELLDFWFSQVRSYAFTALQRGEKISGWKLVEKRAIRRWKDATKTAKEAKKKFGVETAFSLNLVSPNQLQKATKDKDFVKRHCVAISSGLTLVPDNDERPAVDAIKNEFEEIDF